MRSRRRVIRPDGLDADQYEALADKGYDHMEIVDRFVRVDEALGGSYIQDFDIPEEEEADEPAPPPPDDRPCRKHGEPCPVRRDPCPFSADESACRFIG